MTGSPARPKILIVDDTPDNIHILLETLKEDYAVTAATSGERALRAAQQPPPPDLILLDVMMPEMDGYETCRRFKEDPLTRAIPIVFVTALTEERDEARGLDLGAVDFITKPFRPALVRARVRNHLELKRHRDHLEELVRERTHELTLTQQVTIECMASLAETRDPETGGHIRRTQNYVKALAEELRKRPEYAIVLSDEAISLLHQSAPLHDIGKVGVPDHILLKPGQLSDAEFVIMKQHTVHGHDALRAAAQKLGESSFLQLAREIAYTHQEKWDGTGYPRGLAGEEIPLSGRLMALADVYDALISRRIYKPPFTHEKAVAIITEGRGRHFDPDMVDAFLAIEGQFRRIAREYADSDEERDALG